jgi:hypothetical protein
VLAFDKRDLQPFVSKTFHPIFFSIGLIGVFATMKFVTKALYDRYQKKKLEFKNK